MARAIATRPVDVTPVGGASYPSTGLGRGWESPVLFVTTLLLLSFGLVTLYSASFVLAQRLDLPPDFFIRRQAIGAGVGLIGMLVCARLPYHWWRRLAWPLIAVACILLVILVIPGTESIAPPIKGVRRWLKVGITLQPSELAKMAVVIWTAALAVKKQEHFRSLRKGLLPFILVWAAILVPVALEPDLSTAVLIGMLGVLVVFAAGGRIAHFVFLGLAALPFLRLQLGVGFRQERMEVFLDPGADPSGAGFQLHQSLIALGSGGLTGAGFGEGRQKFGFLPEPHNDFIFALIGEEWGFLGVLGVVGLYLVIIVVGFRIARRAPDLFGRLLAIGLTNLIALHAVLHMSVGLGLIPTTGLALPLISYGRSNLLMILASLGVLMSVARATKGRVSGA